MNNKRIGSDFEREICDLLAKDGYWAHFIAPDARGAQPFDIIAVKGGRAVAIDCKTCVAKYISISRLEDNQIMAFEKWVACGNGEPLVAVRHEGSVVLISYSDLKKRGKINLERI